MTSKKFVIGENQEELLREYLAEDELQRQETKEKYRKLVQAGIAKWISDFQKGNIVINSVADLRQLIEMDLQLQKDDE
jgi:hypothetical protein